jgi:hypothetical protein
MRRVCKWAVLFAGDRFIVYHIMRVKPADERMTCVMTYSDPIYLHDTRTPYIALLFYMALSSNHSHNELARTMGLKAPPTADIIDEFDDDPTSAARTDSELDSQEDVKGILAAGYGKLTNDAPVMVSKHSRQSIPLSPRIYLTHQISC